MSGLHAVGLPMHPVGPRGLPNPYGDKPWPQKPPADPPHPAPPEPQIDVGMRPDPLPAAGSPDVTPPIPPVKPGIPGVPPQTPYQQGMLYLPQGLTTRPWFKPVVGGGALFLLGLTVGLLINRR